jgi:hypothetical protein
MLSMDVIWLKIFHNCWRNNMRLLYLAIITLSTEARAHSKFMPICLFGKSHPDNLVYPPPNRIHEFKPASVAQQFGIVFVDGKKAASHVIVCGSIAVIICGSRTGKNRSAMPVTISCNKLIHQHKYSTQFFSNTIYSLMSIPALYRFRYHVII